MNYGNEEALKTVLSIKYGKATYFEEPYSVRTYPESESRQM